MKGLQIYCLKSVPLIFVVILEATPVNYATLKQPFGYCN